MKETESDFVFMLFLNDMRSDHSEDVKPVARANTPEELESFMERERVEQYQEPTGLSPTSPEMEPSLYDYRVNSQTWTKSFRKVGPLEWFNPPLGSAIQRIARKCELDRSDEVNVVPEVSTL